MASITIKNHLDTSAYTAFVKGESEAVALVEAVRVYVLSPIAIGELKAGFLLGARARQNLERLQDFLSSPRAVVPALDDRVTDNQAAIYKQLRRDGRPIPTNDLWIAACALGRGSALFTVDKHFASVDGLSTVESREELEKLQG